MDSEAQVLIEEARRRQRRRRLWIGSVLALSLALGVGILLGLTQTSPVRTSGGTAQRSGGPTLPGKTDLHLDVFVLHGAYAVNLETGTVRSAVAWPNHYLGGYNNIIPRSGHIYVELPFGWSILLPDNLQRVQSLSVKGYSAPGLRPGAIVFLTGTREVEVDVRGHVLRSVPFASEGSPVAEGPSGLVVNGGRPEHRLDLLDPNTGKALRTLGYAWSGSGAMAGHDHFVWIGSKTAYSPIDLNPPVAVHITDLRTGTDTVIANPLGLLPYSLAVSPSTNEVAVLWVRPEKNPVSLRDRNRFLAIADISTRQIHPVPGATGATDLLAWAPHGDWLFFSTSRSSISPGYPDGLSAYKVGAKATQPLSLPKYVGWPLWITSW